MIASEILAFYENGDEEHRLRDPRRSVEYWRTLDILRRHLPPPPARILDIGGGPGIYALTLARQGYEVTLVDPVPLHLEQARATATAARVPLHRALIGDARDLHRELADDDAFDAALLLGPLYHLPKQADRVSAWAEAARLTTATGTVVAAIATRTYACWEMLTAGKLSIPRAHETMRTQLREGIYRNDSQDPRLWTTAYFHHPTEARTELEAAGLTMRTLLGVEGPAKLLADIGDRMNDPPQRQEILTVLQLLEGDPTTFGLSQHLLAIAGKGRR